MSPNSHLAPIHDVADAVVAAAAAVQPAVVAVAAAAAVAPQAAAVAPQPAAAAAAAVPLHAAVAAVQEPDHPHLWAAADCPGQHGEMAVAAQFSAFSQVSTTSPIILK